MGEVFRTDDVHFVLDAIRYLLGDLAVAPSAPFEGGLVQGVIRFFVGHIVETGKDDAAEIPVGKALFGNCDGVADRSGSMGELVYHGPGGVQEIVFPTGVPVL
ncbi:MAG: hypothetical protein MUC41_19365, partial [Syntrophobacteraceae bacterium]|nr:hypothetical protein [Syntrophobacteraceae bacterium]